MFQHRNSSTKELEQELSKIKNLIILVKNMKKPDTFTYMDVVYLHDYLELIKNSIEEELKRRK